MRSALRVSKFSSTEPTPKKQNSARCLKTGGLAESSICHLRVADPPLQSHASRVIFAPASITCGDAGLGWRSYAVRGAGQPRNSTHDTPQLRRRGMNFRSPKNKRKWLVGIVLVVIALGSLAGAIAAGRLRFLFPGRPPRQASSLSSPCHRERVAFLCRELGKGINDET